MNINQMGDLSGFMVNPSAAPNATAPTAFNWGAGGQRIPQGQIDRDRQLADALMAADTSPVYSPWQGLARVAQGLAGGWLDHDARKAETANARLDSERMAQLLSGGGSPLEASGGASPAAGGQNWAAIAFNPNAGPQERAYAENMLKQQQAMRMKQFEYDNRELPSLVRTGMLSGLSQDEAAKQAFAAGTDPQVTQLLPDGGFYSGPRSMLGGAMGAAPQPAGPKVGEIIDGYRFNGGNPSDRNSWAPVQSEDRSVSTIDKAMTSKTVSRAEFNSVLQSLGPNGQAKANEWLRENNIKVID